MMLAAEQLQLNQQPVKDVKRRHVIMILDQMHKG
jgi:hypothetical protein